LAQQPECAKSKHKAEREQAEGYEHEEAPTGWGVEWTHIGKKDGSAPDVKRSMAVEEAEEKLV
tara:strand:+ start:249 stop:437 length:189 start_codon:yes stop_codon:yes gene_type:complete